MNVETIQRSRRVSLRIPDRCQRWPEEPLMCTIAYGKRGGGAVTSITLAPAPRLKTRV
jgi:hypothetical protein